MNMLVLFHMHPTHLFIDVVRVLLVVVGMVDMQWKQDVILAR